MNIFAQPSIKAQKASLPQASKILEIPSITPPSIPLTFSFAPPADIEEIHKVFLRDSKQDIDPNGFVKPRAKSHIQKAVAGGNLAYVAGRDGAIKTLCLAYNQSLDARSDDTDFSEVGSVLTTLRGSGLPQLIVSALALKKYFEDSAYYRVVAKVAPDNANAQRLFDVKMAWDKVNEPEKLERYYTSSAAISTHYLTRSDLKVWFEFREAARNLAMESLLALQETPRITARDGQRYDLEIADNVLNMLKRFEPALV